MKRNQVVTKEELLRIATPLNGANAYANDDYAELIVWMAKENHKPNYFLTGRKKHQLIMLVVDTSDDAIKLFEKKRELRARTSMSTNARNLNKLLASL